MSKSGQTHYFNVSVAKTKKKQAHKIDVLIDVRICNQEKVMGKRAVPPSLLRHVAAHHGPSYIGPGPAFDYDEL